MGDKRWINGEEFMRTLGIDIGTTTISAVVADSQNGSVGLYSRKSELFKIKRCLGKGAGSTAYP